MERIGFFEYESQDDWFGLLVGLTSQRITPERINNYFDSVIKDFEIKTDEPITIEATLGVEVFINAFGVYVYVPEYTKYDLFADGVISNKIDIKNGCIENSAFSVSELGDSSNLLDLAINQYEKDNYLGAYEEND